MRLGLDLGHDLLGHRTTTQHQHALAEERLRMR
jgi:hypothetical protein